MTKEDKERVAAFRAERTFETMKKQAKTNSPSTLLRLNVLAQAYQEADDEEILELLNSKV